jgi:hypothetical protein
MKGNRQALRRSRWVEPATYAWSRRLSLSDSNADSNRRRRGTGRHGGERLSEVTNTDGRLRTRCPQLTSEGSCASGLGAGAGGVSIVTELVDESPSRAEEFSKTPLLLDLNRPHLTEKR